MVERRTLPNQAVHDTHAGFSNDQQKWFVDACKRIDSGRIQSLIAALTDLHSPTGAESLIAQHLADYLKDFGFSAGYRPVTSGSGNCIARSEGSGGGATLMLYAPLDTHIENDGQDVPWIGPELRKDMQPIAESRDDLVIGLGASNPKSMVAVIAEAAVCILQAGVPLKGSMMLAFCGGGMPWRPVNRPESGLSSGVQHMLSAEGKPDFAVILKPADDVYYEHPGLAWFKVTVRGSLGYAGMPRGMPEFRSSIVPAARVVLALERWLQEYPEKHATAQCHPQGWISALRAGWPEKPAFPSAACEVYLDVRTTPDQTQEGLKKEFAAVIKQIQEADPEVNATWELYEYCQGTRTDPDHWVVKSAVRGWEATRGRAYPGAAPLSGQTDAAAICRLGVPIVRIGYPFGAAEGVPEEFRDGLGGMGVARTSDLIEPCQHLIYMIIDSCTRTRAEMKLSASPNAKTR